MVSLQTKVNIIDNSGGLIGRCIKVLTPKNKKVAKIGDLILLSVQKTILKDSGLTAAKVQRGDIYKALVVRTKKERRANSTSTRWEENAVVLVKTPEKGLDLLPVGTRVKGPISVALKLVPGNQKIIALAKQTL
jgi:large subunit ribosomal protein L14